MSRRIMISGAMACHPLSGAGNIWAFLQYVLGLRRLGFKTYYVEQLNREYCVDENYHRTCFSASANARCFRELIKRFGLAGDAALLECDGPGHVGLSYAEVRKLAPGIDPLINISGHLNLKRVLTARAAWRLIALEA